MTLAFMVRIARAFWNRDGTDRRACLYIAPDADVPEQYRGIGIRIEDDIVITETGNENLTASVVKKPEEIEALMAAARKQ